jgi:hypothetical protein
MIEPDATASIASRAQRVVTIAIRPSGGHETARVLKLICPTAKAVNFFERDWTLLEAHRNAIADLPVGHILAERFRAPACGVPMRVFSVEIEQALDAAI